MTNKLYYSFDDLEKDLLVISSKINSSNFHIDVIIGPCRGAYIPGVMLSHLYNKPFEGFIWQTRDGDEKDVNGLKNILNKYLNKNILIIDDINDSGKTFNGIKKEIDKTISELNISQDKIKYCTLFNKTQSEFKCVNYYANDLTPENNPWIVFPYEEWFNKKKIKI